jgi:hypothetical protein
MPALVRFAAFNFVAGAMIGFAVVAVLFLGDSGTLSALGTANDRLLAFFMLAITLAPSFGLGCLGTALCFSWDD